MEKAVNSMTRFDSEFVFNYSLCPALSGIKPYTNDCSLHFNYSLFTNDCSLPYNCSLPLNYSLTTIHCLTAIHYSLTTIHCL